MQKSKIIIDTDPGIDDAVALAVAVTSPAVDVLAVTCVVGNVSVDQSCKNSCKILDVFERKDIPVYRGAAKPLLGRYEAGASYHGTDGLGDCVRHFPDTEKQAVDGMPAALVIVDLARKFPGEISLVAIGPLTNLALAYHLCPDLPRMLKRVIMLGGNYTALGNITAAAEFNFYVDPEAAAVVLERFDCPKWLVPWELNFEQKLYSSFWKEYGSYPNKRSEFIGKIVLSKIKPDDPESFFHISDAFAAVLAIDPNIITKKMDVWATVETAGHVTRGMTVADRRQEASKHDNLTTIILETDLAKIGQLLLQSVS